MTHIKALRRPGLPATLSRTRLRAPVSLARLRFSLAVGLAAALAYALTSEARAQPAAQRLPVATLTAGIHVIQAEVARTDEERSVGLMNRNALPPNGGMLFVFEEPARQCFWMKNTLVPLSIAFLNDDGTVMEINDMVPQSLDQHCSRDDVRYALEMSKDWFSKHGVKPGDRLGGAGFRAPTASPSKATSP